MFVAQQYYLRFGRAEPPFNLGLGSSSNSVLGFLPSHINEVQALSIDSQKDLGR